MSGPLKSLVAGSASAVIAGLAGCTCPGTAPPPGSNLVRESPATQPVQLPSGDQLKFGNLGGKDMGIAGLRQ